MDTKWFMQKVNWIRKKRKEQPAIKQSNRKRKASENISKDVFTIVKKNPILHVFIL